MSCDLGISVSCPLLYWALQGSFHEIKISVGNENWRPVSSEETDKTDPYTNPKTRNRRPDLSLLALHLNL